MQDQFQPSSPSPENLVGSSRGSVDLPRSSSPGISRSHSDYERMSMSPNKALALLGRPDENSSDANHMSDDEYSYKSSIRDWPGVYESHPDTPGPSTSRLPTEEPQQPASWVLCEHLLAAAAAATTGLWSRGGGASTKSRKKKSSSINPKKKIKNEEEEEEDNSNGGGAHTCCKCGRSYTLRSNLSRHMQLECGVERRYRCSHCQKRFSHAHHLRSHHKSIHSQQQQQQVMSVVSQAAAASLTLVCYLVTGRSFTDLQYSGIMATSTISLIVQETFEAITTDLHDYVKIPTTAEEWDDVASTFVCKWNYGHCIGTLNRKHEKIIKPDHSGSMYHNYKGFLALC